MPRDGLLGSTREPCEPVIGRNRRLLSRQVRPNGLNCGYKVSVAEAGRPMPGAVSGMKSTPFWLGAGLFGRDRLMCCQSSISCVWNQWSCSPSGSLSAPIRAVQIAGPGCRATGPHIVSAAVTPVPCRGRYPRCRGRTCCVSRETSIAGSVLMSRNSVPYSPKTTETGRFSPSYKSGKPLRCLVKRQDSPPQPTDSDGSSLCGCEGLLECTLAANCFAKDFEMDSSNCSE